MHLPRIHGNRISRAGVDDALPAQGALRAMHHHADPELIVRVAGKRMLRPRFDGFHPRDGAAMNFELVFLHFAGSGKWSFRTKRLLATRPTIPPNPDEKISAMRHAMKACSMISVFPCGTPIMTQPGST
jgi:hypothetical protein